MNSNTVRHCILCLALLLIPAAARATADTTPPALVSLTFAPGSVDVSSSSQTIAVTAEATDDSSGVSNVALYFTNSTGAGSFYIYLDSPISGTPLDGVFSGQKQLSSCQPAGTYTLTQIDVTDDCDNLQRYAPAASGTATLAFPAHTPTTIVVTNSSTTPPEGAAPVITGITVMPTSIDLTSTNNTVTVTVTGSNIVGGGLSFKSPTGSKQVYGTFYNLSAPTPGVTGTFTSVIDTFSEICDPPGSWTLDHVYVTGSANSCGDAVEVSYPFDVAFPAGTPTTLIVSNTGAQTTPSALVSLTLSSTTADVNGAQPAITGTAQVTTNAGGFGSGNAVYSNGSGREIEFNFYNSGSPETNGTYAGSMYVDSCVPAGVYTIADLYLYNQCGDTVTYTGTSTFPAGFPRGILVLNGTSSTGSLTVDLYLNQENDYAEGWYLDSGSNSAMYSGDTLAGVIGTHSVNFTNNDGFTPPPSQNIDISANQDVFTSGTYFAPSSDGVQVTINPPAVNGEGAAFSVDDGPYQPSGTTVSGLSDYFPHTVSFASVSGYVTPDPQLVTTASNMVSLVSGSYTVITGSGSLTVTLSPSGAITAGAKWSVNGTPEDSGKTVSGLVAGNQTVTFLSAGNAYAPPAPQMVVINANQTTTTSGTYTALVTGTGALTVTILPSAAVTAGAEWNLDGGAAVKSGQTMTGISGATHTVNFTMVNGYITPPSQQIAIEPDETVTTTGTYSKAPPFVGFAQSFVGVSSSGNQLLTLTTGATGKFTGKFISVPNTYSLTGSFSATGFFAGNIAGKHPLSYSLQITGTSASSYQLALSASGNQIMAYPYAYAKGATVAEVGKYTALLTGTDPSASVPQGAGYATLTVSKTGAGSFSGKLGDGTSFSASSVIVTGTAGHELFLFDPNVYSRKGIVSGAVTFGMPTGDEFAGTLLWEKQAARGDYYAGGFTTNVDVQGAPYLKADALAFLSGSSASTSGTGTVTFSAGLLPGSVQEGFSVSTKGVVTITSPVDDLKLKINAATGTITGSFKPPVLPAPKTVDFRGVLLETGSSPAGAGYFLSPVVSGTGLSGNFTVQ